jgi:hypothetical protein
VPTIFTLGIMVGTPPGAHSRDPLALPTLRLRHHVEIRLGFLEHARERGPRLEAIEKKLFRHPEALAALAASLEGWGQNALAAILRDAAPARGSSG